MRPQGQIFRILKSPARMDQLFLTLVIKNGYVALSQ